MQGNDHHGASSPSQAYHRLVIEVTMVQPEIGRGPRMFQLFMEIELNVKYVRMVLVERFVYIYMPSCQQHLCVPLGLK